MPGNTTAAAYNPPPQYFKTDNAEYNLSILRKPHCSGAEKSLILRPRDYLHDQDRRRTILHSLRLQTTLDEGQAAALCENLSRGLAFTQGPPGTGKTFLGVSLVKVLLASRSSLDIKPILVVCLTNHALDSFLGDLRKYGVTKLVRLGRGSREPWTDEFQPLALARRSKEPHSNKKTRMRLKSRSEGLHDPLRIDERAYSSQHCAFKAQESAILSIVKYSIG